MKNCKVYCFAEKSTFGDKLDFLGKDAVYLKDEFATLLKDENSKIIVYDPDYAGWDFPSEILNSKNIKGICIGTTTASYIDGGGVQRKKHLCLKHSKVFNRQRCRIHGDAHVRASKEIALAD